MVFLALIIRIPETNCFLQFVSGGCGGIMVSPQPLEMLRISPRRPVADSISR
jgi:hypothetical protein